MAFQLKRNETVRRGVRRIVEKKTAALQAFLREEFSPAQLAQPIHAARTDIKKLRALQRLFRPAFSATAYRRQQQALRALANALSSSRDATVLAKTQQKLRRQLTARQQATLGRALARSSQTTMSDFRQQWSQLRRRFEPVLRELEDWPFKSFKKRMLRKGIQRACEKFNEAREASTLAPTDIHLHDWRKRVKDLAYQIKLIRRTEPKSSGELIELLQRLSSALGQDHDLSVLAETVSEIPALATQVNPVIAQMRLRLQQSAFRLAHSIHLKIDRLS